MDSNLYGPWTLTIEEQNRLKEYERLQQLTSKKAKDADTIYLRDLVEAGIQKPAHLWVNLPSLVCRIAADLILSQPPCIEDDSDPTIQERIDNIVKRSNLYTAVWRSIYWTAAQGDSYFVIADKAIGGKLLPCVALRRATGAIARNIRAEDSPANQAFLFRSCIAAGELYSEYLAGKINYTLFKDGKAITLPDTWKPSIETKEEVPLAIHVGSMRGDESDSGFGESDIKDIDELCFEISNRLRQCAKILDRHAEPPMNVPTGTLDENKAIDVRRVKAVEYDANGMGLSYATWQSQLSEAYTEIDNLIKIISIISETPLPLLGLDKGGQAESGRALKFRLLTGLGKARRNGNGLRSAILSTVRLALRREDILAGSPPGDYPNIDCDLAETFIADELETAEYVKNCRAANVMSIQQGVRITQDLTGEDADEEVERIKEEMSAQTAPVGLEAGRSFPAAESGTGSATNGAGNEEA